MIFLDEKKPNKYNKLKDLLIPYELEGLSFVRYGKNDGSYVLAKELSYFEGNRVLSYGIGTDPDGVSFETELSEEGDFIHCYDGSIDKFPTTYKGKLKFFKEYLNKDNFKNHVELLNKEGDEYSIDILKMDIEGHEYDWLTEENLDLLANFDQLCIEVHSLIEECVEGWKYEPQLLDAKSNRKKVYKFFENINKHFYLFHIHGNNHAPRHCDLPDSLELTYVNKKWTEKIGIRKEPFPIDGLDEANFESRPDYILDWWVKYDNN